MIIENRAVRKPRLRACAHGMAQDVARQAEQWAARYQAGATLRQIASEAAVCHTEVWRVLTARGVPMRGTGSKPGSRTVWHGLAIRQRAHGATVSEIAKTHGVHPQTVRQVLRRGSHGNAT